jgi:hypothetical protein
VLLRLSRAAKTFVLPPRSSIRNTGSSRLSPVEPVWQRPHLQKVRSQRGQWIAADDGHEKPGTVELALHDLGASTGHFSHEPGGGLGRFETFRVPTEEVFLQFADRSFTVEQTQ